MDPKGPCEYCRQPGARRSGPEDGLKEDLHVCGQCWKLLQNPVTAVQLLRGHLSLEMRGVVKPMAAGAMVSSFIELVSPWKPSPKRS